MRLDRWFVRWMTASAPWTAFPTGRDWNEEGRPRGGHAGSGGRVGRAGCRQGGALRRGPRRRRRAALRPQRRQRPSRPRGAVGPGRRARHARVGDRPARLDRSARTGRRSGPAGAGGLRAGPGDAPGRRSVSGRGEDRQRDAFVIADTGRTRRKQVHWLDAGSDELLEPAPGTQRVRHRPGRRSDPADQPVPRRSDQRLPGPGAGTRVPACTKPGFGTCWPSIRP